MGLMEVMKAAADEIAAEAAKEVPAAVDPGASGDTGLAGQIKQAIASMQSILTGIQAGGDEESAKSQLADLVASIETSIGAGSEDEYGIDDGAVPVAMSVKSMTLSEFIEEAAQQISIARNPSTPPFERAVRKMALGYSIEVAGKGFEDSLKASVPIYQSPYDKAGPDGLKVKPGMTVVNIKTGPTNMEDAHGTKKPMDASVKKPVGVKGVTGAASDPGNTFFVDGGRGKGNGATSGGTQSVIGASTGNANYFTDKTLKSALDALKSVGQELGTMISQTPSGDVLPPGADKNKDGQIDLNDVRNSLVQIQNSDLPPEEKQKQMAAANAILEQHGGGGQIHPAPVLPAQKSRSHGDLNNRNPGWGKTRKSKAAKTDPEPQDRPAGSVTDWNAVFTK